MQNIVYIVNQSKSLKQENEKNINCVILWPTSGFGYESPQGLHLYPTPSSSFRPNDLYIAGTVYILSSLSSPSVGVRLS
jgi:hypothetical protein